MEKFNLVVDTNASKILKVIRFILYAIAFVFLVLSILYVSKLEIPAIGKDYALLTMSDEARECFVNALSCFILSLLLKPLQVITHASEIYIANMKEEYIINPEDNKQD